MILRRFMQHFKEQNWFAVGLDVIVVITGILLALAIEDELQQRQDRSTEREYLELMVRDLTLMEETLQVQREFAEDMIETAKAADELALSGTNSETALAMGSRMVRLSMRRTLTLKSAAFEDLKSAGNLKLIRNKKLRDEILALFFQLDRMSLIIEKNSNYEVDQTFKPFLLRIGVSRISEFNTIADEDIAEEDRPLRDLFVQYLPAEMKSPSYDSLIRPKGDPLWDEVRMQLTWRIFSSINMVRFVDIMLEDVGALKASIGAHLSAQS